jgi:hypothetical protein
MLYALLVGSGLGVPETAMANFSMPCRAVSGGQPVAIFYPLGHPRPYGLPIN